MGAKKNNLRTVTIKTDEENPEPYELIADSIIKISEAFEKINSGRLKRRVILLLIKDMTGIGLSEIEKVFIAAEGLKNTFIKSMPVNKTK